MKDINMGILDFMGVGKGVDAIGAVGNIVDELWTSDDEKMSHKEVMAKIGLSRDKIQTEINKIEAQHRSLFVAGWRPAIGWVCAFALFWHYLGFSIMTWVVASFRLDIQVPTLVGTESLMELVFAMLGMGILRTVEKTTGRAK